MEETSHFERRRDDFKRLSDREFQQRLRLNKHTFANLLHQILPNMTPKIAINNAVPAKTKLQFGLRFLALGSLCRLNTDLYSISPTSIILLLLSLTLTGERDGQSTYLHRPTSVN